MEPITTVSTLVLAGAILAAPKTATPRWRKNEERETAHWIDTSEFVSDVPGANHILIAGTQLPRVATSLPPLVSATPTVSQDPLPATAITDLKEKLYAKLISYLPGHRGGDPSIVSSEEDIVTAIRFIRSLPAGLPLPSLMRNEDGEIGMYWDDDDVYADINIEKNGVISLFSKVRSTDEETFVADVNIESINATWFRANLRVLAPVSALAA